MKSTVEIILKADEDRIGRAVKGIVSGDYTIDIKKKETPDMRAYVCNGSKEYAVVINSGKCFCSCPDRFVNENICKHILMVVFERIYEIREKSSLENGRRASGPQT